MNRNRQTKLTIIIALVVAISAMSIGFAAFSSMLTISSSATVTPVENLNMKIYGMTTITPSDYEDFSSFTTEDAITPIIEYNATGNDLTIDNENFVISNIQANFTIPASIVAYYIIVKNEGMYTTYFNLNKIPYNENGELTVNKICTPGEGASRQLVEEACKYVNIGAEGLRLNDEKDEFTTISNDNIKDGFYKLVPNDYIILGIGIGYKNNAPLADGPFTVNFDDVELEFTTAGPTEQNE